MDFRDKEGVNMKKTITILLILVATLVISGCIGQSASTEGISNRAVVNTSTVNKEMTVQGECFSGYILQQAGYDDHGQSYSLTLKLVSDPSDEEDLTNILNSCKSEEEQIIKSSTLNLGSSEIIISYLTKSGKRFIF